MPIGPAYAARRLLPRPTLGSGGPRRTASSANEGTVTQEISYKPTGPQVRRWAEHDHPYQNLAGRKDISERARSFVLESARLYNDKTLRLQRKWQTLNFLLEGNSLVNFDDPDGAHSPQLYQMRENLEARITDAVLGLSVGAQEWFAVKGREESDRRTESVIGAYLDYELDKNKWKSRVTEFVRCMLTYSFCALKIGWENKIDWRVLRTREYEQVRNGTRVKTHREEAEMPIHSGSRIELVDPFWFIADTKRTNPQEMLFIGNRFTATFEELWQKQQQGFYENVEELFDAEPYTWSQIINDLMRETRSPTWPYDSIGSLMKPDGAPREFECIELWGLFDLYDEGYARECVITVANGEVVMQARENPFDDKHRPYALGRVCKDPFNLHSVGPLDHGIGLQNEIDIHRQLALKGSRLSVSPLVFGRIRSDLGDSILNIEPGKIIDSDGDVTFTSVPSPIGNLQAVESVLRPDLEETAGAPRAYMGAGGDHAISATEYQGRIQEANKRIRSFTRSFTDMAEEVLAQMFALNSQYLTREKRFRVLGRRGKILGTHQAVVPQMFDREVDFEFIAVSNLHIAQMEATNMQLYMNSMALFDQAEPGLLNRAAIAQRLGELLLGERARDFVNVPDDPDLLLDQEEEMILLLSGQETPVFEADDHRGHRDVLQDFMQSEDWREQSDEIKSMILSHDAQHEAMERKAARRRRVEMEQAIDQMMKQPGASPGQGSTPGATNIGRETEAGRGQANGPPQAGRIAAPGRSAAYSGTQNQGSAA